MTQAGFIGENLRLARNYRGMTLEDIGRAIGSERQYILQLEKGERTPSEDLKLALAEFLGVRPRFFLHQTDIAVRPEECRFRKRSSTPKWVMSRMAAHATIFVRLLRLLDAYLGLPKLDLPVIKQGEDLSDAEEAAARTRTHWNLSGVMPIHSMTRVLERAGVAIATFSGVSLKVDAFSWCRKLAVIVRSTDKMSPSRSRFDLAHELGHLVMHQRAHPLADVEAQADRFASAFLLPRDAMIREWGRDTVVDFSKIIRLKKRWGASIAAIVHRAFDLGLIDGLRYRQAFIQISRRGWKRGEPEEPGEEESTLLPKGFRLCQDKKGLSSQDISDQLGIRLADLSVITGLSAQALGCSSRAAFA